MTRGVDRTSIAARCGAISRLLTTSSVARSPSSTGRRAATSRTDFATSPAIAGRRSPWRN
jgi:hypothetical protein